ncbi:hypothetical protein [Crossiella sp. NPDC003009]
MPVPLGDLTDLPATTRMLLAADGSTTALLEALLRAPLTAVIDRQETHTANSVPVPLREKLRTARGGGYVHRHSRLVTPTNQVVSINLVLLPRQEADALLPPGQRPLGRHLTGNRLSAGREALGRFTAHWPPRSGLERCVGKDYLIHLRSGARIYVRELFNPGLVPTTPN